MTTVVRHTNVTNSTGAVIAAGGAAIASGQDYATETINRTLTADDVGAGAGQTQDAAGMIFAEFTGSVIKGVISSQVFRAAGGIDYDFVGTNAVCANYGFSITTVGNVSTLRLQDLPSDPAAFLAAADRVIVVVELGNS